MSKDRSVVAAGHQLTVDAAAEILADGGNAFDAAIAGVCMAFVAEAVFASPGGGGFLMARRADANAVKLFDFFVDTPLKRRRASEVEFFPITADFGPATQEFHIGLGSSATPGIAQGLFAMHEAYARLPMTRLVEPAVRAARTGFPLTSFQAYLFTVIAPILTASEGAKAIFAPGGELMKAGETFRNPELADTLAWLAEDGARLFVDGDVGRAIETQSRDLGGHLTADDLRDYRVGRARAAALASRPYNRGAQSAAGRERGADRLRSRISGCPRRRRARHRHASGAWRHGRRPTSRAPPMAMGWRRVSMAACW